MLRTWWIVEDNLNTEGSIETNTEEINKIKYNVAHTVTKDSLHQLLVLATIWDFLLLYLQGKAATNNVKGQDQEIIQAKKIQTEIMTDMMIEKTLVETIEVMTEIGIGIEIEIEVMAIMPQIILIIRREAVIWKEVSSKDLMNFLLVAYRNH